MRCLVCTGHRISNERPTVRAVPAVSPQACRESAERRGGAAKPADDVDPRHDEFFSAAGADREHRCIAQGRVELTPETRSRAVFSRVVYQQQKRRAAGAVVLVKKCLEILGLVTCCRGGGTDGVVQPLAHKISESSCAACRLIGDQALESLGQADRQGRRRGVYSSVAARTVRQVSLSRWRGPPPAPAVERKRRQLVVQRRS